MDSDSQLFALFDAATSSKFQPITAFNDLRHASTLLQFHQRLPDVPFQSEPRVHQFIGQQLLRLLNNEPSLQNDTEILDTLPAATDELDFFLRASALDLNVPCRMDQIWTAWSEFESPMDVSFNESPTPASLPSDIFTSPELFPSPPPPESSNEPDLFVSPPELPPPPEFATSSDSSMDVSDEIEGGAAEPNFIITNEAQLFHAAEFNLQGTRFDIQILPAPNGANPAETVIYLFGVLQQILDHILEDRHPNDRIAINLAAPGFDFDLFLPYRRVSEMTLEYFLQRVMRVIQSAKRFNLLDGMTWNIYFVEMPRGGGRLRRRNLDIEAFLKAKQSIIRVPYDNDNLCLARAIWTAMTYIEQETSQEAKRLRIGLNKQTIWARHEITRRAIELHNHANVPLGIDCGLPQMAQFQAVIPYQMKVWGLSWKDSLIYSGPEHTENVICLYLVEEHFHVIRKPHAFLNRDYYCHHCNQAYNTPAKHRCEATCKYCYRSPPCPFTNPIFCQVCRRRFPTQQCFDYHREHRGGRSYCETFRICPHCDKLVRYPSADFEHVCGTAYCHRCFAYKDTKHDCYVQPVPPMKTPKKQPTFIFFDIESMIVNRIEGDVTVPFHEVILVVAQRVTGPDLDAFEEFVFWSMDGFGEWLLEQQGATVIAHYGCGYDFQFLVRFFISMHIIPEITTRGTKILLMKVPEVELRIIDSFLFVSQSLKSFPKTFGLPGLAKGSFPHLFSRPENLNYVGDLPHPKYWQPEFMKTPDRSAFIKWYRLRKESGKVFHFKNELLHYCQYVSLSPATEA